MSSGRTQNLSVDAIVYENSIHAHMIATICCNFVFSLNRTSANTFLSEDGVKVELYGLPDSVNRPPRGFRELPSVVTWLPSPKTSLSRIEYTCGQSVFEFGLHYFEVLTEYKFDSSTLPLIGVIEADAAPSSSERFSGLCLSALTAKNTQRRLVGCNALGSLNLHEPKQPDSAADGDLVSGFLYSLFILISVWILTVFFNFSASRGYWNISRSGF
jgi:hypothetical protein